MVMIARLLLLWWLLQMLRGEKVWWLTTIGLLLEVRRDVTECWSSTYSHCCLIMVMVWRRIVVVVRVATKLLRICLVWLLITAAAKTTTGTTTLRTKPAAHLSIYYIEGEIR